MAELPEQAYPRPQYRRWLARPLVFIALLIIVRFVLELLGTPPSLTRYISSSGAVFLVALYLGAVAPLRGVRKSYNLSRAGHPACCLDAGLGDPGYPGFRSPQAAAEPLCRAPGLGELGTLGTPHFRTLAGNCSHRRDCAGLNGGVPGAMALADHCGAGNLAGRRRGDSILDGSHAPKSYRCSRLELYGPLFALRLLSGRRGPEGGRFFSTAAFHPGVGSRLDVADLGVCRGADERSPTILQHSLLRRRSRPRSFPFGRLLLGWGSPGRAHCRANSVGDFYLDFACRAPRSAGIAGC